MARFLSARSSRSSPSVMQLVLPLRLRPNPYFEHFPSFLIIHSFRVVQHPTTNSFFPDSPSIFSCSQDAWKRQRQFALKFEYAFVWPGIVIIFKRVCLDARCILYNGCLVGQLPGLVLLPFSIWQLHLWQPALILL